ncbi:hypothetical protein BD770DRAFT_299731, partial [Pilaira anomala]
YTAVFFFLTKLYTNKDYPSPYFEIEKGLYIIYHLISGVTNKRDVIAVDGGYTLFINQFENFCKNKKINLSDNNFFYPIRKEPNEDLNIEEKHFNDVFSSFRSAIENVFAELGNTFKRFSNNNSTLKTDDYKCTNLQLKVAFLLRNIKLFTETFNIITQDNHKLWCEQDFEFPSDEKLIDIVLNNQIK